jgi:pyruvate carboxylase
MVTYGIVQFGPLSEKDVMSAALYPHVAKEFFKFRAQYGPVDRLETRYTHAHNIPSEICY